MTCKNCPAALVPGRTRHGYCEGCYYRWHRAGRPDAGPPAPRVTQFTPADAERGRATYSAKALECRRRFAEYRRKRFTIQQAGRQVGVKPRTAYRYERWRREQQQAVAA